MRKIKRIGVDGRKVSGVVVYSNGKSDYGILIYYDVCC